jgi:hypothetical protein
MDDEDDVMIWMIDNQMKRRNITDAAKLRLAMKKEDVLKKKARERQGNRNDLKNNIVENLPQCRVRDIIARNAGVSHSTVDKFKYIEQNAPELADDLCAGKVVCKR